VTWNLTSQEQRNKMYVIMNGVIQKTIFRDKLIKTRKGGMEGDGYD